MNCFCALLIGVSLATGQTPVNEKLEVLEPLAGTWEGEIELVEDVPGVGEAGDKLALVLEYIWSPNGQALMSNVAVVLDGVQSPIISGQTMWCPIEKHLVGVSTNSVDGSVGKSELRVDGDKLISVGEGMTGNGTKTANKTIMSGLGTDTLILQVVDRVEGGEKRPDFQVTYHRIDTTSTREEFQAFCRAWKGLWVTSTTLETATPGVGEKRERATEYADCVIADNGNTMICRGYTKDGSNTWIVAYDANKLQLKTMWSTSGGESARGTMYKKGERWVNRGEGCQPDGTRTTWHHVITISDEGETHTWDGKVKIGDEPVVETHEVYHRVGK